MQGNRQRQGRHKEYLWEAITLQALWGGKGLSAQQTLENKQASRLLCFSKCRSCRRWWTNKHQPSKNRMKEKAKPHGVKGFLWGCFCRKMSPLRLQLPLQKQNAAVAVIA